jgi:2-succinyl-5-enolpyruvyl-6-hydroxy-3-cyclohexene-1-carboxylate synthase
VGDLSFLHDLSALQIASRYPLRAVVVVINNDGGRIFSRLPQGAMDEKLLSYFTTPHGLSIGSQLRAHSLACEADPGAPASVRYCSVQEVGDLRGVLAEAFGRQGVDVVEVRVPGDRSAALHRDCVSAAVRRAELLLQEAA